MCSKHLQAKRENKRKRRIVKIRQPFKWTPQKIKYLQSYNYCGLARFVLTRTSVRASSHNCFKSAADIKHFLRKQWCFYSKYPYAYKNKKCYQSDVNSTKILVRRQHLKGPSIKCTILKQYWLSSRKICCRSLNPTEQLGLTSKAHELSTMCGPEQILYENLVHTKDNFLPMTMKCHGQHAAHTWNKAHFYCLFFWNNTELVNSISTENINGFV